MEQHSQVPDSEDAMLAKVRSLDTPLPEADQKLGRRKALQIGVVVTGIILLGGVFLFVFGSTESSKKPAKVTAANRGLAQAEELRTDKELFGKDERDPLVATTPTPESRIPGLGTKTHFPGPDAGGPDPVADVQPSQSAPSIPIAKPKGGYAGNAGATPVEYRLPRELEMRLSENYQKALTFYTSDQVVFSRAGAASGPVAAPLLGVDSALQNLVDPQRLGGRGKIVVSAGAELTAVLNETLNTDYPSVVKATLTSPPSLSGAIALLSYSLGNERANAQVGKIVLPATSPTTKAREITLASVVKSGLPGLGGDVAHHWGPQIAAGLANAGLTAGALAYAAKTSPSQDLGTAVLLSPVIEQGVQGVLKPINYLGRDRPVTVTVPAGTEFTILVTEGFEVTP